MRILLDECVNPRVKAAFPGHEARTVIEMGWGGMTNGVLLAIAQKEFQVFVTIDQNIEYQHDFKKVWLGVLVVKVPDNKIRSYRPIFDAMLEASVRLAPGEVVHVA
jgi:hypothetical protein